MITPITLLIALPSLIIFLEQKNIPSTILLSFEHIFISTSSGSNTDVSPDIKPVKENFSTFLYLPTEIIGDYTSYKLYLYDNIYDNLPKYFGQKVRLNSPDNKFGAEFFCPKYLGKLRYNEYIHIKMRPISIQICLDIILLLRIINCNKIRPPMGIELHRV